MFLDPDIELLIVPDGKKAAIVGINLLINILYCLLSSRTYTLKLERRNGKKSTVLRQLTLCRGHYTD